MSNIIDLKKGLNIPIEGMAALETKKTIMPDVVAETDFEMTDEVDTCTEVDAQVAVLELEIRHLVHNTDVLGAHVEAKLRTSSKIDAGQIAQTDVVAKVERDVDAAL